MSTIPNSPENKKHHIEFEPIGRRSDVDEGLDLLSAAQQNGVDLVAACGGLGICGTCLIRLVNGELSELTLAEKDLLEDDQIKKGYRLACQATACSDARIDIPLESLPVGQKIQLDGQETGANLAPSVTALDLKIPEPTLEDLQSDFTRLNKRVVEAGYPPLSYNLPVLSMVSDVLRKNNWSVRLALRPMQGHTGLVNVYPSDGALLGLAVDMGSTKLAIYLVDLLTGNTLGKMGVMNPQISYGEDVISRIAFANKNQQNRLLLQSRLIETINQSAEVLCAQIGSSTDHIVDAVFVGNTAMHHFFCGLPVSQLGAAPYIPAVSQSLDLPAHEFGLHFAPGAYLHLPPNIAGYVGADHTAAVLSSGLGVPDSCRILVDIGTNTEISLAVGDAIYSCSTASGPAFEGAHIRDGMRAAPGAIEKVYIDQDNPRVITVAGQPPVGLCGTGILHAISELLKAGALTPQGTLQKTYPGVRRVDGRLEYLLVPADQTGHGRDIVVTRKDINEIQLAKGAIRAGIEILLKIAGIQAEDVQEWLIAGAFGTYLDLDSAIRIGMFPAVELHRVKQIGNAAGTGAKQLLLSKEDRLGIGGMVEKVHYIELTIYPEFTQNFVDAMNFIV